MLACTCERRVEGAERRAARAHAESRERARPCRAGRRRRRQRLDPEALDCRRRSRSGRRPSSCPGWPSRGRLLSGTRVADWRRHVPVLAGRRSGHWRGSRYGRGHGGGFGLREGQGLQQLLVLGETDQFADLVLDDQILVLFLVSACAVALRAFMLLASRELFRAPSRRAPGPRECGTGASSRSRGGTGAAAGTGARSGGPRPSGVWQWRRRWRRCRCWRWRWRGCGRTGGCGTRRCKADGGAACAGERAGGMACKKAVGFAVHEDLRVELAVARDAHAALGAYRSPQRALVHEVRRDQVCGAERRTSHKAPSMGFSSQNLPEVPSDGKDHEPRVRLLQCKVLQAIRALPDTPAKNITSIRKALSKSTKLSYRAMTIKETLALSFPVTRQSVHWRVATRTGQHQVRPKTGLGTVH